MKKIIVYLLAMMMTLSVGAKQKQIPVNKMDWWQEAKFGLFVHWGPYCLYGGVYNGYQQRRGGAEWIMNRCKIPVMEYRAKASTFNPVGFSADSLVLMAKRAGMKYVVFTSKHHDGFAMFKSNASHFNIVDYTPYKKDIVDMVAQACRKYGMKIGFYYSHAQDWNNPGGSTARKVMNEGWDNPDSTRVNQFTEANHGAWDYIQLERSFEDYIHQVSIPQIKELLNRYKDMAVLWFDTPTRMTDALAKEIQDLLIDYPQIITNDRLKRPNFPGDYKTPEGKVPNPDDVKGVYWETCMNIGSSWGYKSWENRWKSSEDIIRTLLMCAARGGNLLLNVGPDGNGQVPQEAQQCLKTVGEWLKENGEVVYGTQRSLLYPSWGECIRKDNKNTTLLYLCVYDWPSDQKLVLEKSLSVKQAKMLHGNTKLKVTTSAKGTIVNVPKVHDNQFVHIVELTLKKKLPAVKLQTNSDRFFSIVDEE